MRILYFNYMYDLWGVSLGSTIKAIELMKALRECGHDVKVVWRREQENFNNGNYTPHKPPHPVKKFLAKFLHESNQILTNVNFYLEEKDILEQEKPDLLISRLEAYTISSVYLANKKKIPVIVEADGPVAYEKMNYQDQFWTHQKLVDYFEVAALKNSLLNFTVSNQLKQYFIEKGVPGDSIHVIPNGADPDRFRPDFPCDDVKQQYQLRNNLVIGFVGSFHYWHGVENLIQIIQETINNHQDVKFLMVGDGGPLKNCLEKFIRETNLADQVHLTGLVKHEDIPKYIAAMDIVLSPYPRLKFGYYSPVKLYEYLSSGKAVVSSRMGQISEVIRDGENGFLCEPDDLPQMFRKISELIENPELIKRIGAQARKDVLNHYTWKKRGEQLSALCEAVVSG
jgi:glycosyltransferase involved in cell wall biosynthesis